MGLVEAYILVGALFGCLHLWLRNKELQESGGELSLDDLIAAVLTIFLWLPFLLWYSVKWYKFYQQKKQQNQDFWEKLIERALEKANEELQQKEKKDS